MVDEFSIVVQYISCGFSFEDKHDGLGFERYGWSVSVLFFSTLAMNYRITELAVCYDDDVGM